MDKDVKDFLVTVGGIALLGWLLKKIAEGGTYDKCPRCNNPVNKSEPVCPNCGQPLRWFK